MESDCIVGLMEKYGLGIHSVHYNFIKLFCFLAGRTIGRAYGTMLCPYVCLFVCRLSVSNVQYVLWLNGTFYGKKLSEV